MHRLDVEAEKCTGCGMCLDACNVNSIGWDRTGTQPTMAYPEDCQVCSVCERACPEEALSMVPDWAARYCPPYLSSVKGSGCAGT